MQNQTLPLKRIIIVAALALAIIVLFVAAAARGSQKGTVSILTNLTDTSGMTVTYNGTKGSADKQELAPGDYTAEVTKKGYGKFEKKFTLKSGDNLVINAQLKPKAMIVITSLADAGLNETFPGGTILGTEYFYDRTWAVLKIQYSDEIDVAVVNYNAKTGLWELAVNPGVFYTSQDVGPLPALVQGYLEDNGYVGQED